MLASVMSESKTVTTQDAANKLVVQQHLRSTVLRLCQGNNFYSLLNFIFDGRIILPHIFYVDTWQYIFVNNEKKTKC